MNRLFPARLQLAFYLAVLLVGVSSFGGEIVKTTASITPGPRAHVTKRQEATQRGPRIIVEDALIRSHDCSPDGATGQQSRTAAIYICLRNVGDSDVADLQASYEPVGGFARLALDSQSYGTLKAGGPAECRSFAAAHGLICDGTFAGTLRLRDGANDLGSASIIFKTGGARQAQASSLPAAPDTSFSENFDSVNVPALPPGWTSTVIAPGCANALPWTTVNDVFDTPPNAAQARAPDCTADIRLESPQIAVTTTMARLIFRNSLDFEPGADGAVLEISIAGNSFQDILAAGGSFVNGGYNGALPLMTTNPLANRQVWTANSEGFFTTTVILPASANNQNVVLRWRVGTDSANGTSGQVIDTIMVDDVAGGCTLICPANLTVSNTANQCGAAVNYPAPTPSGSCGTVTCSPPSGSFFPVGTTTVTCTEASPAQCSFTVTVNDTQSPVLTCPPNITQAAPTGQCSANVTYPMPAVNENCAPTPTPICNPPSGSSFPVGTTTVNCTASDASNNSGSCSFTVTVTSNQALTITCPANITTSTGQGQCAAPVNYPPPVVSNNCSETTGATCNPPPGSSFPVGVTTVECVAGSGTNIARCSFTITVNDNQPPSISCPGNIALNTGANQCSAVVEFPAPIASDLCSIATVSCSPPSGSRFSTGTQVVNCTATDAAGNTANCSFTVTVRDTQPPVVTCPPNITQTAGEGDCAINVNLGAATATDACDGPRSVVAGRSDGQPLTAPFPIGITTVTYLATDSSGNTGRCVQIVDIRGTGSGSRIEIMPATITLKTVKIVGVKKAKKRRARGTFMIQNNNCVALSLTLRPVRRVTDQSRFRETDDSEFFSVFRAGADGNPTGENLIGRQVIIGAGAANKQTFVVEFEPAIPTLAGETSNLETDEVLPDSFVSILAFDGTDRTLTINARVEQRVKLIDPDDPQGDGSEVILCRSGDQFTVRYHIYDSNTSDVRSVRYEFLDSSDRVIRTIDNVDLAGPLGQSNLVNGQSFSVEQRFSGANDNQNAVRVRVTVFGRNSSATALSSNVNQNCNANLLRPRRASAVTLYLQLKKLDSTKP